MPLFQRFSPSLNTLFGSIDGYARSSGAVFAGSPGSITRRTNQNGVEFHVHRFYDGSGAQREIYVGKIGECDEKVASLQAQIDEVKLLTPELRLLIREGYQEADPKPYATLASLQIHGLFAAGATLIGSHAFGVLINQLGVRATAYATEYVDVARYEVLAFKSMPTKSFLEMLRHSGIPFVEVPQLDRKTASSSFKQQGVSRFHVDLLVPSSTNTIGVVEVPELKAHATALPYLSYLLKQTQMATLISREGCCLVRVPNPERFAVHKLVVSQLRNDRSNKSAKDIFQAAVLLSTLSEKFPGAITSAINSLPTSAVKFFKVAARQCLEHLADHPRAIEEVKEASISR
jgi:hypothetical protein